MKDIDIHVLFMDQQAVRGPGFLRCVWSAYKMYLYYLYGPKKHSGERERERLVPTRPRKFH